MPIPNPMPTPNVFMRHRVRREAHEGLLRKWNTSLEHRGRNRYRNRADEASMPIPNPIPTPNIFMRHRVRHEACEGLFPKQRMQIICASL